jgi:micrococcal nuclease
MAIIGRSFASDINLKDKFRLTMSKARVTHVIDGQTLVVNNTTTLNLPMIYIPRSINNEYNDLSIAAKEYLVKNLQGKFIRVYQIRDQKRGQENALGHIESYIESDNGVWVQRDMISKGLAFVYPTQSHYEFANVLYYAEEKARQNKTGLWNDPQWAVVNDKDVGDMKDRYAIIEGKIERVATKNNTIYLNFDRNWKEDFTISIQSSNRRAFSKAGIKPMQLSGQKVRVRGWVRQYNGPYIEIYHPSQIEILDQITGG